MGLSFALTMTEGVLAEYALPISATIGLLVALWHGFKDVDQAAQDAAKQGLKEFADAYEKMNPSQRQEEAGNVYAAIQAIKKNPAKVTTETKDVKGEGKVKFQTREFSDSQKKDLEDLQARWDKLEQISRTEKLIGDQEALNSSVSSKTTGDYTNWVKELTSVQKQLDDQTLSLDKRTALRDRELELTTAINDANKTTAQHEADTQAAKDKAGAQAAKIEEQKVRDAEKSIQLEREQITAGKETYNDAIKSLQTQADATDNKEAELKLNAAISTLENERDKKAEKAAKDQREAMQYQLSQAAEIATILGRAFNKSGDDFLTKLGQALTIAESIAKTIGQANDQEGGATPLDILDVGAKVIGGLAGLFDVGGYTGSGSRYEPAGIVHKGEIVFEKPIVDQHKSALLGLRAALGGSRGANSFSYASGGLVTPSYHGFGDMAPVVNAIKNMHAGIQTTLANSGMGKLPPLVGIDDAYVVATRNYQKYYAPNKYPKMP